MVPNFLPASHSSQQSVLYQIVTYKGKGKIFLGYLSIVKTAILVCVTQWQQDALSTYTVYRKFCIAFGVYSNCFYSKEFIFVKATGHYPDLTAIQRNHL